MNTLTSLPVRQKHRIRVAPLLFAAAGICLAAMLVLLRPAAPDAPTFTSLPSPERDIGGISYDGSSLWVTVDGGHVIYQLDPASGAIRKKIPFLEKTAGGSAWDGRRLWQLAWESKRIYQVDVNSGEVRSAFPSPGHGMCSGMTFDGAYLWLANFEDRKIYQIDQNHGGAVLRGIPGLHESAGLAWDGKYLWEGILVGAESHDDAPEAGFFRQRDLGSLQTRAVIPLPGIGPGTSDWLPGQGRAHRFWWYDGLHNTLVRVDLPAARPEWPYGVAVIAFVVALTAALVDRSVSGSIA